MLLSTCGGYAKNGSDTQVIWVGLCTDTAPQKYVIMVFSDHERFMVNGTRVGEMPVNEHTKDLLGVYGEVKEYLQRWVFFMNEASGQNRVLTHVERKPYWTIRKILREHGLLVLD